MKSSVTLQDRLHFMGEVGGFPVPLDADEAVGGQGKGIRPKELSLTSLAGCTAMDVISILHKMQIEPAAFTVDAESELTADHPRIFAWIKLTYRLKGRNIPYAKVEKAVKLSQERYCGVSAMLARSTRIDWEILIDEE